MHDYLYVGIPLRHPSLVGVIMRIAELVSYPIPLPPIYPLTALPMNLLTSYARWLHLRWPAGIPEPLPETGPEGLTAVSGIRIAGDLLGIPLLKFAVDSGAKAVQAFIDEQAFQEPCKKHPDTYDLAIIGGGVAGLSAALAAHKARLKFVIYEASEPFATIANFTNGKPIYTYPKAFRPSGDIKLTATRKEALLAELQQHAVAANIQFQLRRVDSIVRDDKRLVLQFNDQQGNAYAKRVLVCTGRNGEHSTLNVPGEGLAKVHNRLFDPNDYQGRKVLVVGGGDSALETAISLFEAGAVVALSYRGSEFSRPKPDNIAKAQALLGENILFSSQVVSITEEQVQLQQSGKMIALANDAVFVMIGRKAPIDFLKRLGIPVRGQWSAGKFASLALVLMLVAFLYSGKSGSGSVFDWLFARGLTPSNLDFSAWPDDNPWLRVLQPALATTGFYYELAYTLVIAGFGWRRIARTPTPYIRRQTLSLLAVQAIPLFLLPFVVLPIAGEFGVFDSGAASWLADQLFPYSDQTGNREYWRSVGFILAWPLFIANVFTEQPNYTWLAIGFLQTFVLLPWLVYRYGKGVYCGWICSCGALAETLGDAQRTKMPHGPIWNKLNLAGQAILAVALLLLALRIAAWVGTGTTVGEGLAAVFLQAAYQFELFGIPLNYAEVVDYFLAGILGLGLYFHFSGRTWCRFFCPLAALMHIYARFSQFRIFADKDKCISCNICTTVCHQGIDVMAFANKGKAMEDPQCVRCSACVSSCPTGTLSFGRLRSDGTVMLDKLPASPVQMREGV